MIEDPGKVRSDRTRSARYRRSGIAGRGVLQDSRRSRRGSYVLPDRFDSATAQIRAGFEEGVTKMQSEINAGEAVLALFDGGDNAPQDIPILIEGLHLGHKSAGDEIYTAQP